jgi:hypothetical protein
MSYNLSEVRKAMLGFAVPAATVIVSAVTAGSDGGSTITTPEVVTALCAAVITGGTVFGVKNKPARGHRRKANVSEAAGDADTGLTTKYPTTPAHRDPA